MELAEVPSSLFSTAFQSLGIKASKQASEHSLPKKCTQMKLILLVETCHSYWYTASISEGARSFGSSYHIFKKAATSYWCTATQLCDKENLKYFSARFICQLTKLQNVFGAVECMPCVRRRYKGHLEKNKKNQPIKTIKTTLTKIHLRQMH